MKPIHAVYSAAIALTLMTPVVARAKVAPGKNTVVEITVEKRGKITLELYTKAAPKTVAQFTSLCTKGFYNNIKFHRVRPGFIIQAGDPYTRTMKSSEIEPLTDNPGDPNPNKIGTHGSGANIPFERNTYTHETGTISIALSAPRSATGDSQFFINLAPNHMLDGDYCVFGKVTKGMDVVNKIKQGDNISSAKVIPAK